MKFSEQIRIYREVLASKTYPNQTMEMFAPFATKKTYKTHVGKIVQIYSYKPGCKETKKYQFIDNMGRVHDKGLFAHLMFNLCQKKYNAGKQR